APVASVQIQPIAIDSPRSEVFTVPIRAPRLALAAPTNHVEFTPTPSPLTPQATREQAPPLTASPPSLSIGAIQPREPEAAPASAPSKEAVSNPLAAAVLPEPIRSTSAAPLHIAAARVEVPPAQAAVPNVGPISGFLADSTTGASAIAPAS